MQNSSKQIDLIAVLKSNTAAYHRSVEELMPFFRRDFSLEEYVRTLEAFFGFFDPIEQLLSDAVNWSNIGFDFPARRRAHLLRADLRALGSTESSVEEIGRCTRLPAILNQDAALGCLYVLEGSRLGGVIISRELERRFGIGERSVLHSSPAAGRKSADCGRSSALFCANGLRANPRGINAWKLRKRRSPVSNFGYERPLFMPDSISRPVDLSDCAREPIHVPGFIQAFGVLLAKRVMGPAITDPF
jgi:heme oxygenase